MRWFHEEASKTKTRILIAFEAIETSTLAVSKESRNLQTIIDEEHRIKNKLVLLILPIVVLPPPPTPLVNQKSLTTTRTTIATHNSNANRSTEHDVTKHVTKEHTRSTRKI